MRGLNPKRVISVAALVLMGGIVVAAVLMVGRRDGGPPATVSFLRYEESGRSAILQITNLGSSPVFYSSQAYFSNTVAASRRGHLISAGVVGDTAIGLQGHQALELRIPMKLLAKSDLAPSSISVNYWLPESPLQKRLGRLLRPLGINTGVKRFTAKFDLAFPAATNAQSPSKGPP